MFTVPSFVALPLTVSVPVLVAELPSSQIQPKLFRPPAVSVVGAGLSVAPMLMVS
jgi:hypothetical protein